MLLHDQIRQPRQAPNRNAKPPIPQHKLPPIDIPASHSSNRQCDRQAQHADGHAALDDVKAEDVGGGDGGDEEEGEE